MVRVRVGGIQLLVSASSIGCLRIRARRIAIGVMVLAVLFMLGMLHTMHSALKSLKGDRKAQEEDVEGWRHASSISPV